MKTKSIFFASILYCFVLTLLNGNTSVANEKGNAPKLAPFFTLKISSVNAIISVVDKIVTTVETDEIALAEYKAFVNSLKEIKNFDFNGNIGAGATIHNNGAICPFFVLPITDLWGLDIPSVPELIDTIRFISEIKPDGKIYINTPICVFVAIQKKDHLIIVHGDIVDQVPEDIRSMFADLKDFTIGIKLDHEKIDFDTLENEIFRQVLCPLLNTSNEMAGYLEPLIDFYRVLYANSFSVTGGIAVNPKTADTEIVYEFQPRGSDSLKLFANYANDIIDWLKDIAKESEKEFIDSIDVAMNSDRTKVAFRIPGQEYAKLAAEIKREKNAQEMQMIVADTELKRQAGTQGIQAFDPDKLYNLAFANQAPKPTLVTTPKPTAPSINPPRYSAPQMGEFEELADFNKRKVQAEAAHQTALKKFEADLANAKARHNTAIQNWEKLQEQHEIDYKMAIEQYDKKRSMTMYLPFTVEFLGQFNRETMAFPVRASFNPAGLQPKMQGNKRSEILLTSQPMTDILIPFSTLKEAEVFKKQVANGEVVVALPVNLYLMSNENKQRLVKAAVTREEKTINEKSVGEGLMVAGISLLALAAGADNNQVSQNAASALQRTDPLYTTRTVIVTPAVYETVQEIKFQAKVSPDKLLMVNYPEQTLKEILLPPPPKK